MYLNFWLEQLTLFTIEAYYAQHSTYYVPPPPVFQTLRRPWLHIIQNRKTSFRKMCWFQPLTFLNFSKQIMKKGYEYWKRKRNRSRLKTNSMHEVILNCTVCSTACIPKIVTIWWRTPQSPICIKKFAKIIGLHQCLWASYQERSSKMMHFLLFFDYFLTSFTMRCDICYTTVPWKKLHLGTVRLLKQTTY